MIAVRRHVLAALAQGVESGNDEIARQAAGRADWILRSAVERNLEHALIDAALLTGQHVSAADDEAMRHVQRVAALGVAGKIDVDVMDRAAVAEAYRTLPTPAPARVPVATLLTAASMLMILFVMASLVMHIRRPAPHPRAPSMLGVGAYFHGGTPARDPELEQYLVDNLTQLLIETDADRMGSHEGAPRARRVAELRDSAVIAARGPGLAAAWRELIDSLDRFAELPVGGPHVKRAVDDLGRRAQAVSNELARLGLGYYLQGDAMLGHTAHAIVFVYRVEDVTFVNVGGDRRRVLGLRRLDQMNLDLAMLGRQSDESPDPVVLLDRVDHFIATKLAPMLASDDYAGSEIEAEFRAAGVTDPAALTHIVVSTVRRHEARHGLDLDRIERGHPLRYPKELAKLAGLRGPATLRTELELAAYLSQIGNEPIVPKLALWNLVSVGGNHRGTAEAYAARVVVEGLAAKLGVSTDSLYAQGDDKLRTAARLVWIDLYGEPMLPITD